MIERPDADALMAGPLGEWLTAQNADRAAARVRAARWQRRGIIAALAVAAAMLLFTRAEIWTALQLGFFTGLAGFGIGEFIKRPILLRLKGGINGAIARALGLDYAASVTPGRSFETAMAFELLPSHDNSRFEDLWWGTLGSHPFTLHEATLTEERGSGKNRSTVTVFSGSLMQIGFARGFTGTTLVERDDRHRGFFGGQKDAITVNSMTLERANMVDPRFEKVFAVWTSDQVEARYLVHPDYIERLVALESAFAGQKIRALFHGGELLVVLESGDLFESGSLDAADDRALLERTIAQFTAMADLADRLNERPRAGFN